MRSAGEQRMRSGRSPSAIDLGADQAGVAPAAWGERPLAIAHAGVGLLGLGMAEKEKPRASVEISVPRARKRRSSASRSWLTGKTAAANQGCGGPIVRVGNEADSAVAAARAAAVIVEVALEALVLARGVFATAVMKALVSPPH